MARMPTDLIFAQCIIEGHFNMQQVFPFLDGHGQFGRQVT